MSVLPLVSKQFVQDLYQFLMQNMNREEQQSELLESYNSAVDLEFVCNLVLTAIK